MNYQTNRLRPEKRLILIRYPPFKTYTTNQPIKTSLPKGTTATSQRNLHRKVLTNVLNIDKPKLTTDIDLLMLTTNHISNLQFGKENTCNTTRETRFNGIIESYNIGREIGRGAYAIVKECSHRFDSYIKYAVKIYDKQKHSQIMRNS